MVRAIISRHDTGDSPAVSCPADTTQATVPGVMACKPRPIAEESRTHTVLLGKYLHLLQIKYSQYLILLRIFSLHLRNICSRKTAQHPPALNFLMDFVKASRSKNTSCEARFGIRREKFSPQGAATRKPGQIGFDTQIFPIPASHPLGIFLYALQEELWGLKKSVVSKLLAPYGEGIFDGLRESELK